MDLYTMEILNSLKQMKKMISEKLAEQLGTWTCLYPFFEGLQWMNVKEGIRPDINKITPKVENWFKAFKETPFDEVKVVWLGMSPYYTVDNYTKDYVADGLAFSTAQKHSVPPSLFKLYKGIEEDLWRGMNLAMDRRNNLEFLAHQGILLLNAALTTPLGDSKKHLEIWTPFIKHVIGILSKEKENLVFVSFGTPAAQFMKYVDTTKHHVEQREHPAASAYESRNWEHNKLFSKTNAYLDSVGKTEILWDNYLVDQEVPF